MNKVIVVSRIKEIRKGLEKQRKKVVLEEGEPAYIIDKDRLYIGDNSTYGGIDAVNKNHIVKSNAIPQYSGRFDIIYNKINNCTFIIDKNDQLFNINELECNIKNIDSIITTLSTVVTTSIQERELAKKHIATDLDSILFSDDVLTDILDTIDTDQ